MNNLGEEKQLSKLRLILAINDLRYFFSHRKKIAEHFSEQGGKVTVVFLKNSLSSEYTQSSNIRILPLFSSEFLRFFVGVFIDQFRQSRENLSIFHFVTLGTILLLSPLFLLCVKHKFVWTIAGLGNLFQRNIKFGNFLRTSILLILRAQAKLFKATIIVQNRRDFKYLKKYLKLGEQKIVITKGSGVDLSLVENYNVLLKKSKIVVFAGRLIKNKGVLDFVKACENLSPNIQQKWDFKVFGEYQEGNSRYLSTEEFNTLLSSEVVTYCGDSKNLLEELKRVSIFVYPSTYNEGVPKVMIEAGACGAALLSYTTPFAKEIIKNHENGYMVKKGGVNELTDQLQLMLESPVQIERLGRRSRELITKEFDIDEVVDIHVEVYKQQVGIH